MGIDLLEITFRIEKRFGVKFDAAERILALSDTAGTLTEFVWQKLQGNDPPVPDLQQFYNEVSNSLKTATGWKRWYHFSDRIEQTDRRADAERFTRDDCWREVQKILAETLSADLNDVVADAHLFYDLGME